MAQTFKRWWLVLRCSAIGTLVGLIPGLGSAPASVLAYGHAKQTSQDPDSFGKGNIEGVIGAESANDAVEGAHLLLRSHSVYPAARPWRSCWEA